MALSLPDDPVLPDNFQLERTFEWSRYEDWRTLAASDVVPACQPHTRAVCRIAGRGSGCLIASDGRHHGVLLTSAFVLPDHQSAVGQKAVFYEGDKSGKRPVSVRLAPERCFYTPPRPAEDGVEEQEGEEGGRPMAEGDLDHPMFGKAAFEKSTRVKGQAGGAYSHTNCDRRIEEDWLPFTIVACELEHHEGSVAGVAPLEMPITEQLKSLAYIPSGGTCVAVQFPNGETPRRFNAVTVKSEGSPPTCSAAGSGNPSALVDFKRLNDRCDFTSLGAPLFNEIGALVGIQHLTANHSQGVRIIDITRKLFDSQMMHHLRFKILRENPAEADVSGKLLEGVAALTIPKKKPLPPATKEMLSGHPSQNLLAAAANEPPIDPATLVGSMFKSNLGLVWPTEEEMEGMGSRMGKDRCKALTEAVGRTVKEGVYWRDLWETWYKDSRFMSLVSLTHAFPYCDAILMQVFARLTDHSQRDNLHRIGEDGGIAPIIQSMDDHANNQDLIQSAVASLASISSHPSNRLLMTQLDTLPIVMGCAREFLDVEAITQWSIYIALNLISDNRENRGWFLSLGGLNSVFMAMRRYRNNAFLQRWGISSMGVLASESPDYCRAIVAQGGMEVALEAVQRMQEQEILIEATCHMLCGITDSSGEAIERTVSREGPKWLIFAIDKFGFNEKLVVDGMMALYHIARAGKMPQRAAVDETGEEAETAERISASVDTITQHFPTSTRVWSCAVALHLSLGLDPATHLEDSDILKEVMAESGVAG